MRTTPLLSKFSAGELSPWLSSRIDSELYGAGVAQMENMIPLLEGPAERRPGTRYIAQTKTAAHRVRLVPFQFSVDQNYVLEFGDNYLRFYRFQGVIMSGGSPYEISTPWTYDMVESLSFVQSLDVLIILHQDYVPAKLSRVTDTNWVLEPLEFRDGPYRPLRISGPVGITNISGTTWEFNLTLLAFGPASYNAYNIGGHFRFRDLNELDWGWGVITSVPSWNTIRVDVKREIPSMASITQLAFRDGVWSPRYGYPRCGTIFEERLFLAGSPTQPQTIWGSQSGDYYNFAPDSMNPDGNFDGIVTDASAIDFTIGSGQLESILWIRGRTRLLLGTSGGEWAAFSDGAVLTPSDFSIRVQTALGTNTYLGQGLSPSPVVVEPAAAGNRLLFVQKGGSKLTELGYSWEEDSFVDADLSRHARHLVGPGIVKLAYANEPHKLAYLVRADGKMLIMSYNRAEGMVGWSLITTDGQFEDVVVIPGSFMQAGLTNPSGHDEVWVSVRRVIGGQERRYVELFARPFETGDSRSVAVYSDCAITYDGASTTTIGGLTHLNGKTVKVLDLGAMVPDAVVNGGQIGLLSPTTLAIIGLPYKHRLLSLKLPYGSASGSGVGLIKRLSSLILLLLNSVSVRFGTRDEDLRTIDFRKVADPMDTRPPTFTGEWPVDLEGDWDRDTRILLESDDPFPFTLVGVVAELKTNELS